MPRPKELVLNLNNRALGAQDITRYCPVTIGTGVAAIGNMKINGDIFQ